GVNQIFAHDAVSSSNGISRKNQLVDSLSPPNMSGGPLYSKPLPRARLRNLGNLTHAPPLGRDHEQGFVACASEHARETTAVKIDGLLHLSAFADADAALVWNVCVPDTTVGIQADTVRNAIAEIGPNSSVHQTAVRPNVESGESFAVRFSND